MNNWLIIARMEVLYAVRNKIFLPLTCILWLLLLTAFYSGYHYYTDNTLKRAAANEMFRSELEEQHLNPHAAAHWGTYLFKPLTMMALFDPGLNSYTGNYYRVEAHKQHEINFADLRDRDAVLRLGKLSVAMVFQILAPLLIILLCFSSVSREREFDTLKILLIQGVTPKQILWGKIAGNYTLILLIILPVLFALAVIEIRMLLLSGIYLLYFFVITVLMICISALSRTSAGSLLCCLGVWALACMLLPRIAASVVDHTYKLPSTYLFNQQVEKGYLQGMGNDGSYVERGAKFDTVLMRRFNVDSLQKIPAAVRRGLSLQNAEDYNTMVYNHYSVPVENDIKRQQELQDKLSFLDPVIGVRQLSMSLSGTDFLHHIHFYRHAQWYRNDLIRRLNLRITEQGNHMREEGPDFFRQVPFPIQPTLGKLGDTNSLHGFMRIVGMGSGVGHIYLFTGK